MANEDRNADFYAAVSAIAQFIEAADGMNDRQNYNGGDDGTAEILEENNYGNKSEHSRA